jgi:hypothetical protein
MADMINRTPLRDALLAAGVTDVQGHMLYQDYLNIITNMHGSRNPITEEQWELLCDMLGGDRPYYASNVKQCLENLKAGISP